MGARVILIVGANIIRAKSDGSQWGKTTEGLQNALEDHMVPPEASKI